MDRTKIAERAQALHVAHGNAAEAEAAAKARLFDEVGDGDAAATWRAIREAISELRRAPES